MNPPQSQKVPDSTGINEKHFWKARSASDKIMDYFNYRDFKKIFKGYFYHKLHSSYVHSPK